MLAQSMPAIFSVIVYFRKKLKKFT